MKISFKTVLAFACAASAMNGFSQTEQYFRASANGGISTIQYTSDEISSILFAPTSIGGGVTAEYVRFFNRYIGASAGVGASVSRSKYDLNKVLSSSMPYYFIEDEIGKDFVYKANFMNWEERQMLFTVDIPIGAIGKYCFSNNITTLVGLGVKIQLPVYSMYKLAEGGSRTTTGYYDIVGGTLQNLPSHGFYTLDKDDDNWDTVSDGELNTKSVVFAAYLDLGVMQKIGNNQFYYGIYGQYGFSQLNAKAETSFLNQYGVAYDSPLNTKEIDKSRLLSFGIKLGYVLPMKKEVSE